MSTIVLGCIVGKDEKAFEVEFRYNNYTEPCRGTVSIRQLAGTNYDIGSKLKLLVVKEPQDGGNTGFELSRDERFVAEVFTEMIPEIKEGTVKIVRVVRDPGKRIKVAVRPNPESEKAMNPEHPVRAVTACIGSKGSRINKILAELDSVEKLDVVEYSDDPETFIRNAIVPAKADKIIIDTAEKSAILVVDEDNLGFAVGKAGCNVKTATKLTGYKITAMVGESFLQELRLPKSIMMDLVRHRVYNEADLKKLMCDPKMQNDLEIETIMYLKDKYGDVVEDGVLVCPDCGCRMRGEEPDENGIVICLKCGSDIKC